MLLKLVRICAALAALLFMSQGVSAEISVLTWNINGGQKSPQALRESAEDLVVDLGNFDVVVVQEV